MSFPILEKLGLSINEAKIYLSLVESGEASISQIAIHAKIHRRNAYDAIHRLLNKGLIFQIIDPRENKYNAVDPDKLKELLAERSQELEQILPGLHKQYHKQDIPEAAYIYRGLEGQKTIWREILRSGKDSYALGAKGNWYEPKLEIARKSFFKEANKRQIKFIQIFDQEALAKMPDFPKNFEGSLHYRILPPEYSSNSILNIFDDYVITYTGVEIMSLSENTVFFVLKSRGLADSYRTWFQYMWDKSEEPKRKKGSAFTGKMRML